MCRMWPPGMTYMQQRYYDPLIGRFLSVDPVTADGNTGGNFNRYWYANNNPYKFKDPDGRLANFLIGAGIGAGIEIVTQLATKGTVDNWTAVGVSAGVGALTGGVASIAGKAAVSGAITARTAVAATAATGGVASGTGKVVEGALTGEPASGKEVAVATLAGVVGSGAGAKIGLNAVAKLETMAASNGIAGHVGRTTQAAVQQGGKITEASTSATQKATQVTADVAASYSEKKINK